MERLTIRLPDGQASTVPSLAASVPLFLLPIARS